MLHRRIGEHDLLDLFDDRLGAVDRSALGQLDMGHERALILGRQEACRRDLEQPAGREADTGDQHQHQE